MGMERLTSSVKDALIRMNTEQLTGILRIFIPMLIGWFGTRVVPSDSIGPLTELIVNLIVSAVGLGAMLWSFWANRNVALVDKASKVPEVRKVIAEPHIADVELKDNPKVVSR